MKEVFYTNTNAMTIFENMNLGKVRVVIKGADDYWFCLSDICDILGIQNNRDILKRLDDPCVDTIYVGVQTGYKADGTPAMRNTSMLFINESGLYSTIFQSRKPQAKEFQNWVFNEVLPSIRRTGMYAGSNIRSYLGNESFYEQVLEKGLEYLKENRRLREENAILKPYADRFQVWLDDDTTYTIHAATHIMGIKGIGLIDMFRYLRKNGYVNENNVAYKEYEDMGLFVVIETKRVYKSKKGYPVRVNGLQTTITRKGMNYFRDRLLEEGYISLHRANRDFVGKPDSLHVNYIVDNDNNTIVADINDASNYIN